MLRRIKKDLGKDTEYYVCEVKKVNGALVKAHHEEVSLFASTEGGLWELFKDVWMAYLMPVLVEKDGRLK